MLIANFIIGTLIVKYNQIDVNVLLLFCFGILNILYIFVDPANINFYYIIPCILCIGFIQI